jgi:hypothetical protein
LDFDPEEIITLDSNGQMTLRTAVERVIVQDLQGLNATIFRRGKPSVLGRLGTEKLATAWTQPGSEKKPAVCATG